MRAALRRDQERLHLVLMLVLTQATSWLAPRSVLADDDGGAPWPQDAGGPDLEADAGAALPSAARPDMQRASGRLPLARAMR